MKGECNKGQVHVQINYTHPNDFFPDMRLDNSKAQWQLDWVLKDKKDFNKDLRTEEPTRAKIPRHASEGCILKLLRM